jgi:small conductance mechanosensitive channel
MEFNFDVIRPYIVTYGLKLILALLVFVIGKWLSAKISELCARLMEKQGVEPTLTKFLKNITYYILLIAVLIAAAGQLGINTTSFLTVLAAASLAIGLALKDSLSNFSSGIMLILFRPFKIGDVVTVAGQTGKIDEITVFNTIMTTGDNQKKIIPNGAISNTTITNINANPTRRVDLTIGIGYDDDIRKAKQTLEKIISEDERILKEPAPTVAVSTLGESSVDLVVRPWVNTGDYWNVYFSLIEKIKLTFDEEKISFPYPQRDVHLYKEDA